MADFWVNGIVSHRDHKPYVQLSNEKGVFAQLSVAEARVIAVDILQMVARSEADAMIWKFFSTNEFPRGAGAALMVQFRDFRAALDDEEVQHTHRGEPPEVIDPP